MMTPNQLQARAIEAARDALNDSYGDVDKAIAAYETSLWSDDMLAAPDNEQLIVERNGELHMGEFDFVGMFYQDGHDSGMRLGDFKRWRYPPAVSGEG